MGRNWNEEKSRGTCEAEERENGQREDTLRRFGNSNLQQERTLGSGVGRADPSMVRN